MEREPLEGDEYRPHEKPLYLAGTREVLEASQEERETYRVTVNGLEFVVLKDVFSPKYFADTAFFARELPIEPGQRILELGPGTGAISVTAALTGAEVWAVDVNPAAVENTLINARLHSVANRLHVVEGDLYGPVAGQRFDLIFWNTPFGYVESADLSMLERAVFDPHYAATVRFLAGACDYLTDTGRLLIGFSSTLGDLPKLERLARQAGFELRELASMEAMETHPVRFELLEAVRR